MKPARPLLTLLAVATLTATGCTATVPMEPAELANDPACAEVMVRLPGELAGQPRQWTDAQSTGAWGEPSAVLLTCGIPALLPTTLPCQSVDSVDWVIDDSAAPNFRVTTFGRDPAVEVYLDTTIVSSRDVLEGLSPKVAYLPSNGRQCLSAQDVEEPAL